MYKNKLRGMNKSAFNCPSRGKAKDQIKEKNKAFNFLNQRVLNQSTKVQARYF